MILLDTNIVSEMMRPDPNSNVISWLNEQQTPQLFLSSITIAEVGYGLYVLPEGKRKQQLQLRFEQFTKKAFSYRILDFTEQAAKNFARVMGDKHQAGRPMSVPDGQIAAIALANGFALATRNIKDFEDCGVELLNPFEG
ncbi:type II toxin-antitoxin system VapC family toxin [uncultured Cocleimonas sp.]|uniref:type II toxin-antitoxin system VapC family toxin n=1 Tax=uncultured Cocleimonas sp. TaxID=1051587 RepID=UPI00263943A0|nr:type II toxin-antitoxin system VapC family toxin [uncultured Cocleimonas sp.]